jgi:hypothetical protein
MRNRNRWKIAVRSCAALAACVVLAGAGRASAQVNNVVQTMIPDFYQHQGDNGGGGPTSSTPSNGASSVFLPAVLGVAPPVSAWSPDFGYCAYVSDLDALYPWQTLTVAGTHPYDNNNVWLFGAPGAPGANPGVGSALSSAGTWSQTADDKVIPNLLDGIGSGSINTYLAKQKVGVGNLGVFGLVDTQYQTNNATGQVQVFTADPDPLKRWKNIPQNTFQLYQQLTSTGANLPATLQPLAAITTTLRLNYAGANNKATTGFWWGFHQVAGAGVAGANTIQYSDPDAIPINAGNNTGGNTQAAVDDNEYVNTLGGPQLLDGSAPVPGNTYNAGGGNGNKAYTTGDLYSTMVIDANGNVTGGTGPYATGLKAAAAPVAKITNLDAVSMPAAQLANVVVGPVFDAAKFLFSGNFGGDITKLEVFANAPLYAANPGLSETDPNWNISQISTDPFGNSWSDTNGGILLTEGAGGSDLMENGTDFNFTEDTTGAVTAWTVYAYDQADGYWLTQTYGAGDGFGDALQVPEPSTSLLMATAFVAVMLFGRRRSLPHGIDCR